MRWYASKRRKEEFVNFIVPYTISKISRIIFPIIEQFSFLSDVRLVFIVKFEQNVSL